MQVSVEKVSNVQRRLTIIVPAEQVEAAVEKQIDTFIKKSNIKGFRPGKAPKAYILNHYGLDARKEALSEIIQKNLYQAIEEQQLRPVSTPQIEPKNIEPNQPLEFVASFEVLPEIEKIKFDLKEIEKPVVTVSDEDVSKVIEQLQKQYTTWKLVEREAKQTDRVVLDYQATFEGQSSDNDKVENYPLELGSQTMIPGFEDALMGAKAGDERAIKLTFPDDFHMKERAGKPIAFNVTVKQVFEANRPEKNEDFIAKLGVKSGKIEDLQAQIKQTLEQERDRLVTERLKSQIFKALLEQNTIEVPQSMVEREAGRIHDEMYPKHQAHDHHEHSPEETASFNEVAQKRVALGLLLAEYAKQTDIKPDKERITKRIMEIAQAYEHPQEVIQWLTSDQNRKGIEAQVVEDQVMDKLMAESTINKKPMTYAELKGIRI